MNSQTKTLSEKTGLAKTNKTKTAVKMLSAFGLLLYVCALATPAYAAAPVVTNAQITGINTAVITFAYPVTTSVSDYSNFGGSLSGRNLINLVGSGTNTITLTFDGSAMPANATGSLTIGTTLVNSSDNTPMASSYNVNLTDAQPPTISSFQISSNNLNNTFMGVNNTLSFTFTADEPLNSTSVTVNNANIPATGSSNGPYTVSYGVPGSSPAQLPVSVTMTDTAGNSSQVSFSLSNSTTIYTAVTLTETTRVPTTTTSNTPTYQFTSTAAGTITYFGNCTSPNTVAVAGVNTITFNPLSNGVYNNCYVEVVNGGGQASNLLPVSTFTVSSTSVYVPPAATQSVTTPDVTVTPTTPTETTSSSDNSSTVLALQFTRPLYVGSSGPDVSELQRIFTAYGIYSGPITGYFGVLTEAAVERYQGDHGLEQIGSVGPATRALLNNS